MMTNRTHDALDDRRWRALRERDSRADGSFFYGVRTTGTYSRPSCAARPARRASIVFFRTAADARAAGYRPCLRCRPDEPDMQHDHAAAVREACRLIDESGHSPDLGELAAAAGYSPFHFHRVFKALTGITPHAYHTAGRARRLRRELLSAETITDAMYNAGFNSSGNFYTAAAGILGMTPTLFRSGGHGATIGFAAGKCPLGTVLVATADRGACAVLLGDDGTDLRRELAQLFPHAELVAAGTGYQAYLAEVLAAPGFPVLDQDVLPDEVRRTVLRERVRQELRDSAWSDPPGQTPRAASA